MLLPAVVLAAGASSRMGQPKALLRIGAHTFVGRLLDTLRDAGLDDILVVTGVHDREIRQALAAPGTPLVRIVHNPHHARGQLSSLQAALAAMDHPGLEAMLVALVDLPLAQRATVRALVGAWRATRAPVVRPRLGLRHGHPVIFDRAVFNDIQWDETRGFNQKEDVDYTNLAQGGRLQSAYPRQHCWRCRSQNRY